MTVLRGSPVGVLVNERYVALGRAEDDGVVRGGFGLVAVLLLVIVVGQPLERRGFSQNRIVGLGRAVVGLVPVEAETSSLAERGVRVDDLVAHLSG